MDKKKKKKRQMVGMREKAEYERGKVWLHFTPPTHHQGLHTYTQATIS
jgi:hypothetical protein